MIPNIVLMGPPGSGKGSLAAYLSQSEGYAHLCSGDLLRDEVKSSTETGSVIKEIMSEGGQVPDEIITKIIIDKIKEMQAARTPFVLDGFPQTFVQKSAFDAFCNEHKDCRFKFISIHVDPQTALDRMTKRISCLNCHQIFNLATKPPAYKDLCDACGNPLKQRESDSEEKARLRLKIYGQTTKMVMELYESETAVKIIDGNLSQDEIYKKYGEE